MQALAAFTDWETGKVTETKLVDVIACRPCKGAGLIDVAGITKPCACIICGGRGIVIKDGFFGDGEWTIRNAKLV